MCAMSVAEGSPVIQFISHAIAANLDSQEGSRTCSQAPTFIPSWLMVDPRPFLNPKGARAVRPLDICMPLRGNRKGKIYLKGYVFIELFQNEDDEFDTATVAQLLDISFDCAYKRLKQLTEEGVLQHRAYAGSTKRYFRLPLGQELSTESVDNAILTSAESRVAIDIY